METSSVVKYLEAYLMNAFSGYLYCSDLMDIKAQPWLVFVVMPGRPLPDYCCPKFRMAGPRLDFFGDRDFQQATSDSRSVNCHKVSVNKAIA
jgi:hypothetical protein